jgi:hypothetical protein
MLVISNFWNTDIQHVSVVEEVARNSDGYIFLCDDGMVHCKPKWWRHSQGKGKGRGAGKGKGTNTRGKGHHNHHSDRW